MNRNILLLVLLLFQRASALPEAGPEAAPGPGAFFKIRAIDDQTGRGIPCVELRTVHHLRFCTDSAGLVAFQEPGLMNQEVFFHVSSHGYEYPKDGFGYAGVRLKIRPGGAAEIKLRRRNLAERLYRVTGGGIYRDSVLLGERPPLSEPLLSGQVLGQDSVMAVPWNDRIYWFWGDTCRPAYPLGLFKTSGATSALPGQGGLPPSVGVDLKYFVGQDGFSRPMCPWPGEGLIWLDGVLVAPDRAGQPRLVTHYARMKDLGQMLEHGLAVFDETKQQFVKHREFDLKDAWRCPRGHTLKIREGGKDYYLFTTPFATVRAPADLAGLSDPENYEAFTCLAPGTRYETNRSQVERRADGGLVYGWKRKTDPLNSVQERQLITAGQLQPDEAFFQVRDVDTGKTVDLHSGSVAWNRFRHSYLLIAVQSWGEPSFLGEVWIAESDSPAGPWRWAKKIVTHNRYSFYNPVHHPFFDEAEGRYIYFEGTYVTTFSGNPDPTPWYDYNQIMYRLDLAQPDLPRPLRLQAGP